MATALSINCEVPQADIAAFEAALARYEKETKRDMRAAVRSATIDLVKSLRRRTRKAPRQVPRMDIAKSYQSPKWIRDSHGGKPIRRMSIIRWNDGHNYLMQRYIYGGEIYKGPKGGKRIRKYTEAQMRTEARRVYGQIRYWGLAKKSWGWFMHALFHKSVQDENPKAKVDSRMVERHMVERDNEIEITIVNKLDYIRKALFPDALPASFRAAANVIDKKISAGLRSRRFGA